MKKAKREKAKMQSVKITDTKTYERQEFAKKGESWFGKQDSEPHRIEYNKPAGEYLIVCEDKDCYLSKIISQDHLQEVVRIFTKDGDNYGSIEGWFEVYCNGVDFYHA
jgi:hypothetical protein